MSETIETLKQRIQLLEVQRRDDSVNHLRLVREAASNRQRLLVVERERDSLARKLLSIAAVTKLPPNADIETHVADTLHTARVMRDEARAALRLREEDIKRLTKKDPR